MYPSLLPLFLLPLLSTANPISPQAANAGANAPQNNVAAAPAVSSGKLSSEGATTFDGVSLAAIPAMQSAAVITSGAISRTGWTVTCDSYQPGNECIKAIDGDNTTLWHTQFNPSVVPLPHSIIINMQQSYLIGSVTYEPRQDGGSNGNIGQHTIAVSTDGNTFSAPIAVGLYIDDNTLKMTTFTPVNAQYVKITALSEAGNRGQWTSMAEVNVFYGAALPPAPANSGSWGLTIDFPLVPVSAAIETTTGRLLVWSSYAASTFGGSNGLMTLTSQYDPSTKSVTQTTVTSTGHDMFCEGLSMDFSGRAIAAGGNTDAATSIYDPTQNAWIKGGALITPRGYQAQATCSDGRLFTIGASWSGGQGGKNGEIYSTTTNTWTALSGAPVTPLLTADAQGVYRADNHAWLFGWKNGYVFQAGPSKQMNWYGTAGSGSQASAGNRASDTDSMCGNAVMYDAANGKILTMGGSPSYQGSSGTTNAHIVTIGTPNTTPNTQTVTSMNYARAFANGVAMPDGKVFVVGGQVDAEPFSDATSQLTPELYNPATNSWAQMAPISMPRNYHSTALLLPDGTVFNGGGGLCGGCATNHYDGQIWSPPYLYTSTGALATRPVISSVSAASIRIGGTLTVKTNVAVQSFSLIRMGSTTHTVNTDQRRIALNPTSKSGFSYTIVVPNDAGVALPGYWMLFALTSGGVPSVASITKITP